MKKNRINITKLTFILIIFMSIIFFNYGNDFYWHVRIGEFIFKKRAIPYTDIFSWYGITNNLHWISHEWLFEVIIYLFQVLFGKSGAIVYTVIAIIILSHLIYKINESIFDKNKFYTIAWAIIGLISLSGYILPRPHLLSYIYFTIIIIFIIRLITNENSKLVFFTPIAIIMWANSHGGSSNLSYIIFALTIISSILPFKNKLILTKKQLYKLFYGFMCSIIFIIFNPHGIKMIIYPYQNITYTTMTNCIDEWQSINLTSINGICYSILIIGILLYILKNIKRVNLYDILLLFSFTI